MIRKKKDKVDEKLDQISIGNQNNHSSLNCQYNTKHETTIYIDRIKYKGSHVF